MTVTTGKEERPGHFVIRPIQHEAYVDSQISSPRKSWLDIPKENNEGNKGDAEQFQGGSDEDICLTAFGQG
jgi:hypothetical protein